MYLSSNYQIRVHIFGKRGTWTPIPKSRKEPHHFTVPKKTITTTMNDYDTDENDDSDDYNTDEKDESDDHDADDNDDSDDYGTMPMITMTVMITMSTLKMIVMITLMRMTTITMMTATTLAMKVSITI